MHAATCCHESPAFLDSNYVLLLRSCNIAPSMHVAGTPLLKIDLEVKMASFQTKVIFE